MIRPGCVYPKPTRKINHLKENIIQKVGQTTEQETQELWPGGPTSQNAALSTAPPWVAYCCSVAALFQGTLPRLLVFCVPVHSLQLLVCSCFPFSTHLNSQLTLLVEYLSNLFSLFLAVWGLHLPVNTHTVTSQTFLSFVSSLDSIWIF